MKLAIFDTHLFDRAALLKANERAQHELVFYEMTLNEKTAVLAQGFPAVCIFVHDVLNEPALKILKEGGTELVVLRCAGFNNVDLKAAAELKMHVTRVPEYSPYAVAEHAMALLLALNRKLPRAFNRVREGNFSLDGLVGFDLHGKTMGVIGLGKIGSVFARIARGFGCKILAYDIARDEALEKELQLVYAPLEQIYAEADVISLHVPLTPETFHMINRQALDKMKPHAILINTSRGALIKAADLVEGLKAQRIGGAALDVYEEEEKLFFRDLSGTVLQDDVLARLLTFPNVLITAHQGFLTKEALQNIAATTVANVSAYEAKHPLQHELTYAKH